LIVLDTALVRRRGDLLRILVHEIFHFVWLRLNNAQRRSWELVLEAERHSQARGGLGWSSEGRLKCLEASDCAGRSRRWREYACEAFCDTAAWLFAGLSHHPEFTLAHRWKCARRQWFAQTLSSRPLAI
jgi:hypothetical protein